MPHCTHHLSLVYKEYLFVYGGYDNNNGKILSGFLRWKIPDEEEIISEWEIVKVEDKENPGPLYRSTGWIQNNCLYVLGGKPKHLSSSNLL